MARNTLTALAVLAMLNTAFGLAYVNDFVNLGGSPRAVALAGAMAADTADPACALYNPASLAGRTGTWALLTHAAVHDGMQTADLAVFGHALDTANAISAVLLRTAVDGIWDTRQFEVDNDGRPVFSSSRLGTVDNSDYALFLNYARTLKQRFHGGVTVKFVRRRFDDLTGYGAGLNAGAQYLLPGGLTLGLTLANLSTTTVRYYADDYETEIPEARAGFAFAIPADYFYGRFLFLYQAPNLLPSQGVSEGAGRAGIEYVIRETASFRAGFEPVYGLSLGAGIRVARLSADVSWAGHNDLKDSYRFSLAWRFSGTR